MHFTKISATAAATLLATGLCLQADDWLQWRGADFHNNFPGDGYVTKFNTTKNVLWKTPMPGRAGSSPILWNNNLYLTSPGNGKNQALCIGLDGKVKWQTEVGNEVPGKHKKASGSNPSPISDGEQVYAYFKSGDLAALNEDGQIAWHINVQKQLGKDTLWWDLGTSPVLSKDNVIITVMHALPTPSYIAAFNKKDGKLAWKVDRQFEVPKENDQSYTTPVVLNDGKTQTLLVWGSDHLTAHDLDRKGAEIWRCGNFNPDGKGFKRTIASAVPVGDVVVVPYDRGKYLAAIKMGGKGDVTKTHRAWEMESSSDVPTPASKDGLVYVLGDKGLLSCIEAASGDVLWREQLPKKAAAYSSSPVIADDKIYCVREDATVFVAQAGKTYKLLAQNILEDERCYSTPLMMDGNIYLRTLTHLYCFGSK